MPASWRTSCNLQGLGTKKLGGQGCKARWCWDVGKIFSVTRACRVWLYGSGWDSGLSVRGRHLQQLVFDLPLCRDIWSWALAQARQTLTTTSDSILRRVFRFLHRCMARNINPMFACGTRRPLRRFLKSLLSLILLLDTHIHYTYYDRYMATPTLHVTSADIVRSFIFINPTSQNPALKARNS